MNRRPLVRDVMDEFRRLVQMLRSSHRAAENINVTGAQLFVMTILAEAGGAMSVNELAQKTQTDPSTVSVVVNRLVERGLVKRERSASDARRVALSLTARGRKLRARAPVTVAQKRLAESLENLSRRDLSALRRTLAALLEDMGANDTVPKMMFDDAPPRRGRK